MELRLQYPPTPEGAHQHAELCVSAVHKIDGIELDYSVDSLTKLDGVIEKLRKEGIPSEQVGETLFAFGCYVGEVFVRNLGGRWRLTEETPMAGAAGFPIVVECGNAAFCNPIAKVFRRLEQGAEHSLPYFYQVFAQDSAK